MYYRPFQSYYQPSYPTYAYYNYPVIYSPPSYPVQQQILATPKPIQTYSTIHQNYPFKPNINYSASCYNPPQPNKNLKTNFSTINNNSGFSQQNKNNNSVYVQPKQDIIINKNINTNDNNPNPKYGEDDFDYPNYKGSFLLIPKKCFEDDVSSLVDSLGWFGTHPSRSFD